MIDVLTLNYNDADTMINFIHSVENYSVVNLILVVDNNSTDDSYPRLKKLENHKIKVIQTGHNGGYGAGNNFGIRYLANHSRAEYVLQCNPDVIITEKAIYNLARFLHSHPDYAIAAPFMLNKFGKKEMESAFPIPTKWQYILSLDIIYNKIFHPGIYEELDLCLHDFIPVGAVAGSLLMLNLSNMIRGGMYDEHIFLYCEEISLAIKLKKSGLKTAILPKETFIHNHSVSITKTYKSALARRRLLNKSKLYVIKHYYRSGPLSNLIAWLLAHLSLLEIRIISFMGN